MEITPKAGEIWKDTEFPESKIKILKVYGRAVKIENLKSKSWSCMSIISLLHWYKKDQDAPLPRPQVASQTGVTPTSGWDGRCKACGGDTEFVSFALTCTKCGKVH
jgi:hypothetical protein